MKQPSRVKSTISGNGMPKPTSKISPNINDNGTLKAKGKKKGDPVRGKKKTPATTSGGKRIGGIKTGSVGKPRKSGK